MSLPFLRKFPNGKAAVQQVERPHAIVMKGLAFLKSGGWYVIEILPSGQVQLTATDDDLQPLVRFEADNGPKLMDAVDDLVERSQPFIRTEH